MDYAFVSNVSTRLIDAAIISNNEAETNPLFRGFHFSDGSAWYTNYGELPEDFWDIVLNTSKSSGGEPLPSWSSWINNGLAAVAYGGTVTGGSAGMLNSGALRYYANAWKGNQYIKTFNNRDDILPYAMSSFFLQPPSPGPFPPPGRREAG